MLLGPPGGRDGLLLGRLGRTHEAGLDAEFAEREVLVGVEHHARLGGHDQILAPSVLEQVAAQLVDHLLFDAAVAGTVLGREPHRVLVGHIHAGDRERAVGVHLAGELAGEFHRTHLRAEDAPEGPLDEVGDRRLDALQQVHGRLR